MKSYIGEKIQRQLAILKAQADKPLGVKRKIFGVKVSTDHGETWKTKALCDECISKIEPPARVKKEIEAGVKSCDDCGVLNEK